MQIKEVLKSIGLTDSEVKVYLALIKLNFSSKGAIVRESKIAHSKIYDVLNKLIDKGLVSSIIKNNVHHYSPAPVHRLKDYIIAKKNELNNQEKFIDEILPQLSALQEKTLNSVKAELFLGWKGMETVYSSLLYNLDKGDTLFVLGANKGFDSSKTIRFFQIYASRAKQKGIRVKLIFDEDSRDYVLSLERLISIKFNKRFLFKKTPVEFLISKDVSAIVILRETPIVLLVHDLEIAESFKTYFSELWRLASH